MIVDFLRVAATAAWLAALPAGAHGDCSKESGVAKVRCGKEVAAFKACEVRIGREFARCVKKATNESPIGH